MKPLRSFIALFLLLSLSWSSFPSYAEESKDDPSFSLHAASAVLMDASSGRILYEKNGYDVLPMASTTKIMTCILALEYGDLSDYVETSSYAAGMPKVKLSARAGECFLLKDLLYSLMLESHNDSAVMIAEHLAGSVQTFADMMNQKARDLGCFDTCFVTPNGLDATVTFSDGSSREHSTTASDLAKIMSYCIMTSPKKDEFLTITRTPSHSFSSYRCKEGQYLETGRVFSCHNHNAFLSMMDGALSGKTGFTGKAGYCYVGALRQQDRTFVVALLACGWPNHKTYKWSDTKALMTYGLENYEFHRLSEVLYDENLLDPIPVMGGQTDHIGGTAYTALSIHRCDKASDPDTGMLLSHQEAFVPMLSLDRSQTAPLAAGTQVGKIDYLVGDQVIYTESIVTVSSVPAIDLSWCLHQILSHYLLPCS